MNRIRVAIVAVLMAFAMAFTVSAPAQAAVGGRVVNSIYSTASFKIQAPTGTVNLYVGQASSTRFPDGIQYWYLAPGCTAQKFVNGNLVFTYKAGGIWYRVYVGDNFALIYKC